MNGKEAVKADFANVDAKKLTLVDSSAMDESVLSGNIVRVVENQCESELRDFNRSVGYLLGRPDLETAANPLAPTTIVEAFTDALHGIPGDKRLKLAILKELNQTSLGDINEIYADLNKHLDALNVVPQQRSAIVHRGGERGGERGGADAKAHAAAAAAGAPPSGGDIDLMAVLQRLASSGMLRASAAPMSGGQPSGAIQFPGTGAASAAAGYGLDI